MRQTSFRRTTPFLAAVVAAAAFAACDDDPTGPSAPAALEAVSATSVSGSAGGFVAGPTVRVLDASGNPIPGVTVNFAVTAGGGGVQNSSVVTGSDGVAAAGTWTLGSTAGTNTITASVEGVAPVVFTASSSGGTAAQLQLESGNNQFALNGSPLPAPLVVRVTDLFGNAAAGSPVTFTVQTGGGTIPGTPVAPNAQGLATSGIWTLGTDPCAFTQTVRATAGTLQTTFTATTRPTVAVGSSVAGTLAPTDCIVAGTAVDEYRTTATAGQALLITLASTAFDAQLNVKTTAGTPVAANNNASGATTNSRVRLIAAAGILDLAATAATAGATGAYTLSVADTSSNVVACGTTFIQVGASTTQTINQSDCVVTEGFEADEYLVYLAAGTRVNIAQQSAIDAYLFVIRPSGVVQAEVDNGFLNFTEQTTFTATETGFYRILASSWGLVNADFSPTFDAGPYTLSVTLAP